MPDFGERMSAQRLLALSRPAKQFIVIAVDIIAAWLALWLAFTLRLEIWHWPSAAQLWIYVVSPALFVPIFIRFGLYRAIFRYTGLATMQTLLKAACVYGLLLMLVVFATFPAGVPRSVGILQPILFLALVSNTRAWARFWLNRGSRADANQRLLIYGAGSAGAQTAAAVANAGEFRLLGFIDEDPAKVGRHINGVPVFAPDNVADVVHRLEISDILLALPSVPPRRRREIIGSLRSFPVHVRTLPGMADLATGRVSISDFRELDIEDLLGREPVQPNHALLARDLASKVVLVTGAGGSIGSELCRQILAEHPTKLILVDHNEFGLYGIHEELMGLLASGAGGGSRIAQPEAEIVPLLGSVRSYRRMSEIFRAHRPDTVYHAAAYKHVPIVEHNPCEGVENNVNGTLHVARCAVENATASFVLISTDKAVRPTNVMGASKRVAELVLQALASEPVVRFEDDTDVAGIARNYTRFCMVRFGNVLGSSGSVVPLFRRQIEAGGPITLTHPEVTRYFMSIPEAAQLVLQAGAMAEGGEVFLLDMGQPVRIMDLARRMVELQGRRVKDELNPSGDIEIQVTGLRPGEKLYEELLIGDSPMPTAHVRIMKAREDFRSWNELRPYFAKLDRATRDSDVDGVLAVLRDLVSGYGTTDIREEQATTSGRGQVAGRAR